MRLALELLRMHFRKPTSFAVQTWNPISHQQPVMQTTASVSGIELRFLDGGPLF
jgi:hypothetical protein